MTRVCLILSILISIIACVSCQNDCPYGWSIHNNKCWYFAHGKTQLTWYAAESWCQQNNGHLASFATVEERDWVVLNNLEQWDDTRWWIGLNDNREEKNFEWSDGSPYNEEVSFWKPLEPNNAYLENCVEIWIERTINNRRWNDRTCEGTNSYICKRDPGTFSSCPDNFVLINERCYWTSSATLQWFEAQESCKALGANLVSISSSNEQSGLQNLIQSSKMDYWSGLSDTSKPNTLQWVDGTSYSYENWAPNQPPSPLPYQGSTCVEMNFGLGYLWSTSRCGEEKAFVCERGLKGDCPTNWAYNKASGKCYEFVMNSERIHTWTTAKQICSGINAGLLKIESEDESVFVGSALQLYSGSGYNLVYIGGSDIGHDDRLTWWDQTSIQYQDWAEQMPEYISGRDDCLALYAGSAINNWETVTCFEERPFICSVPEGQTLAYTPIESVEGKCESGWRHFNKKCYFFGSSELTQQNAKSYCSDQQSHLTSILDSNEESFIVGHMQKTSWIGLEKVGDEYVWIDKEPLDFENWNGYGPSNDGPCVQIDYVTGEWMDTTCPEETYFICKKDEIPTETATIPPPTYIPDYEKCGGDGWISDPTSDRCYKVNLSRRNWQDARYECQLSGGELAAINSPNENAHVLKLVQNNPNHLYFWLGGNDLNHYNAEFTEHGWIWSDGSAFNYLNWNSGEPNNENREDCMNMDLDGFWWDVDCFNTLGSICEKKGNMQSIIGVDPTDENCASNSACCFKHIGAEYGGRLPDSVMSASSVQDRWFTAERGRLNTPSDVIIISVENEIFIGNGHGAWSPLNGDTDTWLQVDFLKTSEIKGIITQGRNGILQADERQWVKSFKVSYTQDAEKGKWEFISDSNGEAIIFPGNSDQNTPVTNLFPRPILARYMRCYPVTWQDKQRMRLEYIGCQTSCLHKLGMNSGMIPDSSITASSSKYGNGAKQARAPVDAAECLSSNEDKGESYRGWISKTINGRTCQAWSSQTPWQHDYKPENFPDSDLSSNRCRNPDSAHNRPWCFTTDLEVKWEECDVPICPDFSPIGWSPSSLSQDEYVQVQFTDYFKVSGITIYKPATSTYVTSYLLHFSDDGMNFIAYQDQGGNPHVFTGLDSVVTEYTDILREPITTMYIRILPQKWSSEPLLQFELHGCYADSRATCSDSVKAWRDGTNSFTVSCPSGCVEDTAKGIVYGTDTYTSNSAICPAAIHAGKLLNKNAGSITVNFREGMGSYTGSVRNGIESQDFGHYGESFVFEGNTLQCSDGWLPWQNHCYYVSIKNDKKSWHEARTQCLNFGGDLVSILSDGENSFIEGIIYQADIGGDVWIGLNDLEVENYYQWSDRSPVTITKWFWDEPKPGRHRCVNIYRFEAYWNDKDCDTTLGYVCKKEKQLLPPSNSVPVDEGCEEGWKAFGSSCYQVSPNLDIYNYGGILCAEKGGHLVTINNDYEQAFLHSYALSIIPPGLGLTSYIGMTAKTIESGSLKFEWDNGDLVTYTHWDLNEPEVKFSCAFPFQYEGITFYECTTYNHPANRDDQPWCSIDPVYAGRWVNCGTGSQYGCAFMNEQTGFWQVDLCAYQRYYVCEKNRLGYTQPQITTPSTAGSCADGWYGDEETTACYQINEKNEDNRSERLSWDNALEYCRAQGADLVSIHSYEEENKIISFVSQEGVYSYVYFWIGLIAGDSDVGYVWTDGTPVSYVNWNYGEPNNNNDKELCAEGGFTYSGYWNDLNCDAVRNWICKIPKNVTPKPPPTFPPPEGSHSPKCGEEQEWILYTTDYGIEKCYWFEDKTLFGWSFAERNCSAKGGHLVAVHSAAENSFLLSWGARTSVENMWIGLKDVSSVEGRSFQWSDESTPNFFNWGNGEPNNHQDQEDCAEMQTNGGLWNDDNCGTFNGFICEKFPGASSVKPPATPPATGGCPDGFMPFGNKCYWYSTGSEGVGSYYDFSEYCASKSALPATIQNTYEQAFLTSQLKMIGRNTWIGLYAKPSMEYVWYDQSELSYTNWDEYEPNGYYESNGCVHLSTITGSIGKWADEYCYDSFNYFCYTMKSTDYPEANEPSPDCMTGYLGYGDACYKIMDTKMTRNQAQQTCESEGSDVYLMSVDDIYENNLFKSWFLRDITSDNSLWTGLTFETGVIDEEKSTTFKWDNGWPVEYTNWAAMQPDVEILAGNSGCIRMDNQGNWIVESASACETKTLPFICKQSLLTLPTPPDPGEGSCDPGFLSYGPNCYFIQNEASQQNYRSWFEAAYECESRGATLASFHSEEECLAIIKAVDSNSQNFYIGLSSDGYTGWKWADESAVDFLNWNEPDEPNGQGNGEDCVEMYSSTGKWNDVNCLDERKYICKKPKEFYSCSSIEPGSRLECGYFGIEESVCLRRSCCWDPLYKNENISSCYFPYGIDPSGVPVTDQPIHGGSGLSAGAIFGIIAGVIALIAIVLGGVYCYKTDKTKNLSMPSIGGWSTMTSSGKKKAPSTVVNVSGGFDNPVINLEENETI